ncbi:hypothetical protein BN1088_1432223 [Sphingobacterium sp. PM2-P1-29]|nr:hypothetical protein BN1088_1432223 [Sphingobacterium sp. PM2-P1-29]
MYYKIQRINAIIKFRRYKLFFLVHPTTLIDLEMIYINLFCGRYFSDKASLS